MASELKSHSVEDQHAQRLRAAMGVGLKSDLRLIEIDGCRIAVEERPERRLSHPLVCLHAAGSGSREFRPLLERSPSGSRLVLFDWPGHGRSEGWDSSTSGDSQAEFSVDRCTGVLRQVLGRLGLHSPILLGAGFGAAVAIQYAAETPGQVCGLVLCQPAGLLPPRAAQPKAQQLFSCIWSRAFGISGAERRAQVNRQSLRLRALRPMLQTQIAEAEESLRGSSADLTAKLGALACPILFALSRESREYPLERYLHLLDPLLARAPQHRFAIFSGGFHPLWDEPERFAQALASFVQAQLPLERHRHSWILTAVDWPTENTNLWKCVHPDCRAERMLPSGHNANEP